MTADLNKPNGISGTPDDKTLFVADIGADKTYAYDIQPDGALAGKRLVCPMGSDGMTVDDEGNFYLTGHGVTVFDKTGKRSKRLTWPNPGRGIFASAARITRPFSSRPAKGFMPFACGSKAPTRRSSGLAAGARAPGFSVWSLQISPGCRKNQAPGQSLRGTESRRRDFYET